MGNRVWVVLLLVVVGGSSRLRVRGLGVGAWRLLRVYGFGGLGFRGLGFIRLLSWTSAGCVSPEQWLP